MEDGDLPPRAVMAVPVRRREELIALISLGRTPLGEAFGDSERDLLTAMADQLGLHIENFRLRDQDWELSRVRELQERLLPKTQTGIKGYDVAHVWRPMRSVSGVAALPMSIWLQQMS